MVFQASPESAVIEYRMEAVALIDRALSTLRAARRELVAANRISETKTTKAG